AEVDHVGAEDVHVHHVLNADRLDHSAVPLRPADGAGVEGDAPADVSPAGGGLRDPPRRSNVRAAGADLASDAGVAGAADRVGVRHASAGLAPDPEAACGLAFTRFHDHAD